MKKRVAFIIIFLVGIFAGARAHDFSKADSLVQRGYGALKMQDTSSAVKYAEQALQWSRQTNYSNGKQNSLLLLARIYRSRNQFGMALDYYFQALNETQLNKNASMEAEVQNEIGDLYFDSDLYDKALDYYLLVNRAQLGSGETAQQIKLLKSMGFAFDKIKEYKKALEYYAKVLPYYQEDVYKKQRAGILIILSDLSKKSNQYTQASEYELKNLEIRKELKDTAAIAIALNNLGAIHNHLGNKDLALNYFLESYELKNITGDENGKAITCINIGTVYQELGRYDEALKYLQKAYDIQIKTDHWRDIAHTCNLIAVVYYYKKNYLKAESYSLAAVKYAQRAKANELLETSYKILSHIYRIQGNNEEALNYYQQYSDIKDSIALQQKIQQQELYQKNLEVENKEAQIRYLRIDQELRALEYKKLQLEKEKSDKDWELLKRDKDIQEITLRQQQLQQEKAISLLKLKEQQYQMEAGKKQLMLLKQEQLLKDREEQNKLQALKTDAEINDLKLRTQDSDLRMQKIWQAISVGLFLIILVIIGLVFNRYKLKQKASQSILNHKNLEMEQKFLRAQMNPHFMFNALNSIQSFVMLNDTSSAERYLAKFSRLMRYILDNTSQPYISIETEIKTLQLYIELEQLRFDFKFDFTITVSPDIDPERVVIPPMLTQPYVENAIIHGIVHKKEKGHITVGFIREGESIIASIVDDGIGRDESLRRKRKSPTLHKSMGMQVTKDRLELLNEIHGSNFDASIIDLKDPQGNAIGTRVDLKILYKEEPTLRSNEKEKQKQSF